MSEAPTEPELLRLAEPGEPAVRGHFLRCAAAALDALAHQAPLPAELNRTLSTLRRAPGLGFVPIAELLPLVDAAHAVLGTDGARVLVLDSMQRAMGAPPWRRLVLSALRRLEVTLPAMARWVPRLYALVYRDTGTMRVRECGAEFARIDFESVPEVCFRSATYAEALGFALEFYFEVSGRTGSVTLVSCEPAEARINFEIRVDASSGRARSG